MGRDFVRLVEVRNPTNAIGFAFLIPIIEILHQRIHPPANQFAG